MATDLDPTDQAHAEQLRAALAPSFVLARRLGSGGMGSVYLARDPVLKRMVAVKMLSPELASEPDARSRFQREAQSVAAISHPNVLAVYSVGELPDRTPYFVMQYVNGPTIGERLEAEGPMDVESARRVLGEVASALAAAHRQGIIHRDIKPSNILWDDQSGRALVTDFGIAAIRERENGGEATRITQTGVAVGSPAYMSPEQLLAERVTEKTDIYALGLLGYELLTGAGPYEINSPREVLAAHLRDTPKKLSTIRSEVNPELEALLESCLSKDPANRPSAQDVARRLSEGAGVLLEWPPPELDRLHGASGPVTRLLTIGAFALAIPLLSLAIFERDSKWRDSLPPAVVMATGVGIGAVLFLVAAIMCLRLLLRGSHAVRDGYGWATVCEVVADRRGDTGALIAGAREYAALSPAERNKLRSRRMTAAALRLGAAFSPVLGFFAGVAIAAGSSHGPAIVLWLTLFLALMLLATAVEFEWRERIVLRSPRRRLRTPRASDHSLAPVISAWEASFQQVRRGQSLGTGLKARRGLIVGLGAAAIAGAAGLGLLGYSVAALGIGAEAMYGTFFPTFANIAEKVRLSQRMRSFRLPVDSTITPLRAGEALYAISHFAVKGPRSPLERPPARAFPGEWAPFPASSPLFRPSDEWLLAAIRTAPRGLTAAQRRLLEQTAVDPVESEFIILAHARHLDYPAAIWQLPFSDSVNPIMLPVPRVVHLKRAAYAHVANAALDLADGRPQAAEQRLREVISVGFLLEDEGRLVIENLVGVATVGIGRAALQAFYEATGQADLASEVSHAADPPINSATIDERSRPSMPQQVRMMRSILVDTTQVRGMRWEIGMFMLAYEPCSDLHQLVFGPDSSYMATMAAARRSLVRRRSDSLLFNMAERALDRPLPVEGEIGLAMRVAQATARLLDRLVGGRRFASCMSLVSGLNAL